MLEIDFATILFEILNFVLLSFLLYRFLFKPVMARVQERAAEKEALMQELAAEKDRLALERATLITRLSNLDEERDSLLAQAEEESREEKALLLAAARQEADQIHLRAESAADRWRSEMVQQYETELIDTVFTVSRGLLSRTTPVAVHERMVENLAIKVAQLGREDMTRVREIRRSLSGRQATVFIETALPLNTEQQHRLLQTFTALADKDVSFDFDLRDELVAGLRARIGDLIIDHSLAGELEQLRSEVKTDLGRELLGHDQEEEDLEYAAGG
ncbi:MAG: F0F1 ATP synthase subunit delta [Ardenticatenaceae bacterium]|nr:F0F1 ATP synthase subunit delta [Ardenticatenaceae bacterium]